MDKLLHFRSRVFLRIFLVILFCALLPIGGLVTLTYHNVENQLTADTSRRLHHASKNIGMAVIGRLNDIEVSLAQVARQGFSASGDNQAPALRTGLNANTFLSIRLFPAGSTDFRPLFSLTKSQLERIQRGKAVIVENEEERKTDVWMVKPAQTESGQQVVACGQINLAALLEYALVFLPTNAQVVFVNKSMHPLFGSGPMPEVNNSLQEKGSLSVHHYAEIAYAGETWLAGRWVIFLRASFEADSWHVLVYEPKAEIFASLYQFARNAGLTSAVAFWVILLVSSVLVRKILLPLHTLQQATRQVGAGEYDCKVNVESVDEFGELARSFNLMAGQIKTQLFQKEKMSQTINDMLGEIKQNEILLKLLNGLHGLVTSEQVGFVLYTQDARPSTRIWQTTTRAGYIAEKTLELAASPVPVAQPKNGGARRFMTRDELPQLFEHFIVQENHHFITLPISISPGKQGTLIFVYTEPKLAPGESAILNQLADQLEIALTKADMVDELDHLNLGILTALARSVDAYSKWTQGHSERVTRYALAIAEEMGFDEVSLADVHRAGLLHDLGKISVPAEILNKNAKLTAEERQLVMEHPSVAANILAPIRVFDNIRSAVEQHHECWDGSGYPYGLKGEEIHPIARILSVADVFDALYSDRPYRDGWSQQRVISYLNENSGQLFEPKVVEACISVLKKIGPLMTGMELTLSRDVI